MPIATDSPAKRPSTLILINGFYPKIGGAEKQAQSLARALQSQDRDVAVLTLKHDQRLPDQSDLHGLPVTRISMSRIPLWRTIKSLIQVGLHLWRTRERWDVYYVVIVEYLAVIAVIAARLLRKRVILKFTGLGRLGVGYINRKRFSRFLFRVTRHADVLVAVSPQMQEEIVHFGYPDHKVKFIPNGVDHQRFRPAPDVDRALLRQELGMPQNFIAVYSGRFVEVKDIPTLLRAWQLFSRKHTKVLLLLIGDGPLRSDMEKMAHTLGIDMTVKFTGHRDDVDTLYRVADVGILPSLSEGLSNTLLEYMASGTTVVASDIDGNRDVIVHESTGILFPPGRFDTLADILTDIYHGDKKYPALRQNARQMIESCYSMDAVAEVYANILADPPRPKHDMKTAATDTAFKNHSRSAALLVYHFFAKHIPDNGGCQPIGHLLRRMVCQGILGACGRRLQIGPKVDFGRGRLLRLGDDVKIGRGCQINLNAMVEIENGAQLGEDCLIYTQDHGNLRTDIVMQQQPYQRASVKIGQNARVGPRAILVKGITIGDNAVVAPGSVVTKDVPAGAHVIGIPAKIINDETP